MIITWGIHGFYIQETWLLGLLSATILGHLLLLYFMIKKTIQRVRTISGVAIILGPALIRAWKMVGKPPPITYAINSNFPGRIIGITLCFPNWSNKRWDKCHKKGKGRIKIFLSSIYNPVDHYEKKRINKELAIFYNAIPRNSKLLAGQDINANIGVQSKMFSDVIVIHGL